MEGNVDGFKPPIKEVEVDRNRQESLKKQLDTLDPNRKDHQVLSKVLTDIYQNYEYYDQQASKSTNIHYFPKCAEKNTITETIFGQYKGSYEYISVIDAVENIPDPYKIFPKIESIISESKKSSNLEIITKISETITNNTDTPVIIEPFQDYPKLYSQLKNGNIYSHLNSGMKDILGIHQDRYSSTPEILSDIEKQGLSEKIDHKNPAGHIIMINELKIDDPSVIKTSMHELGHIVEKEYLLKEDSQNTEVISSLYGIKTGLLMAEIDPQKSADMILNQIILYNWILTGTTAP
ncbi:MAG: hypothetical protein PHE32_03380 [Candidatus Shapirobacteria bacterium]|nr:hypothetical protein [Candidatus Shapirobacteria bacterium]MDD4410715.1 hypothetical protein [Candidatus Shapirobacteria bacterium]